MSDLAKSFQDQAKKFLDTNPTSSASIFREILKLGLEVCNLDKRYLTKKWGMSSSTIRRWLKGETVPHLALRPRIIRDLERRSHIN